MSTRNTVMYIGMAFVGAGILVGLAQLLKRLDILGPMPWMEYVLYAFAGIVFLVSMYFGFQGNFGEMPSVLPNMEGALSNRENVFLRRMANTNNEMADAASKVGTYVYSLPAEQHMEATELALDRLKEEYGAGVEKHFARGWNAAHQTAFDRSRF